MTNAPFQTPIDTPTESLITQALRQTRSDLGLWDDLRTSVRVWLSVPRADWEVLQDRLIDAAAVPGAGSPRLQGSLLQEAFGMAQDDLERGQRLAVPDAQL